VVALIQQLLLPAQLMQDMKLLAFTLLYLVIHKSIDQVLVVAAQLRIPMMHGAQLM
jgi:hypothetical protein